MAAPSNIRGLLPFPLGEGLSAPSLNTLQHHPGSDGCLRLSLTEGILDPGARRLTGPSDDRSGWQSSLIEQEQT